MARKVMVAVHGIGDQFRYETVQSVANQVCRYFGQPAAIPLGMFHSALFVAEPSVPATLATLGKAVDDLRARLEKGPAAGVTPQQVAVLKDVIDEAKARLAAGAIPPAAELPAPQASPGDEKPAVAVEPPRPLAALVLKSPPGPELPVDFGFAEVYWADIPRNPVRDEHTLEEAKKWARTLVERVRLQFLSTHGAVRMTDENYEIAGTVLAEMIETVAVLERLLYLAEKAGVLRFDLKKVMTDYLGDVQLVTEFKFYREQILATFDKVMGDINDTKWESPGGPPEPPPEIYIVAHSEGTVVTFLGLLEALRKEGADRRPWVANVKGFMTIGSPINKHLVLWPELWPEAAPGAPNLPAPIKWCNYYDYGDPIGFELETTRTWLAEHGWGRFFAFTKEDDFGFGRYPFPGKAHNDYWQDDVVFGHFIQNVVRPEKAGGGPVVAGPTGGVVPRSKKGWQLFSRCFPYALAFALCYLAVYLLYKAAHEYVAGTAQETLTVLGDVLGLSGLVASLIAIARVPRLTLAWECRVSIWLLLLPAAALYAVVSTNTQELLAVWLPPSTNGSPTSVRTWAMAEMIGVIAVLALVLQLFGAWSAYWGGTRALVIVAGVVTTLFVVKVATDPRWVAGADHRPVWPLLLAGAVCFYLWWLAVLVFDLTFVWHRYVRSSVIEARLGKLTRKDEQFPELVALLAERLKPDTNVAAGKVRSAVPPREVQQLLARYGDPDHRRAVLTDAYAEARKQAAAETGTRPDTFPKQYPGDLDAAPV